MLKRQLENDGTTEASIHLLLLKVSAVTLSSVTAHISGVSCLFLGFSPINQLFLLEDTETS